MKGSERGWQQQINLTKTLFSLKKFFLAATHSKSLQLRVQDIIVITELKTLDPVVDLYLNTELTQQQIAEQMGFSRTKVKSILLKNGVSLKAKRKNIGGRKRDPKWGSLLLEAVARKGMTLLEDVNCPAFFQRVSVACPHHPEGRKVLVKSIINAKHCCHKGNANSISGKQQRAQTMSKMWDDPEKKIPLLRSASGHYGSDRTKLYVCKILTSN